MPNLNDLITPAEIVGYIRAIETPDLDVLSRFLPVQERPDNMWRWDETALVDEPAIDYRAPDTELPFGARQGVKRAETELPFLGKKKLLTEEQKLRLDAISRNGDYGRVVAQIYDDIYWLVRGVKARWELDRGSLLSTGSLTVKSLARDGSGTVDYAQTFNYNVPGGNIVTASTAWTDTANADIVANFLGWTQAYKDANNGMAPGAWIINTTILNLMLRSSAMRSMLYFGAPNSGPSVLPRAALEAELQAHGIAPLVVLDGKVTNSSGTLTSTLAQNKVIGVPPEGANLGATAVGVTATATGMVESGTLTFDEAPGITGWSKDENDPPRRFNAVDAAGMPGLANPSQLFIATVSA